MIVKRLITAPSSKFGSQTIIRRSKVNLWGTYGYNNFAHDKPDHFPPITKAFHTFVGLGITLPMLDWEWLWPKIEARYHKIKDAIPFIPKEVEDPEKPKLKTWASFRIMP